MNTARYGYARSAMLALVRANVVEDRWLSVEDIATHLGISKETVYKWIARKKLPAHKVGKLWKFDVKEVDDWVRTGGTTDGRNRDAAGSGQGGARA